MNSLKRLYYGRSWQMRYGLTVSAVLLSFVARGLLFPLWGSSGPFLLFIPAVMLSAWYGGLFPGLLATLLSALLGTLFFVHPFHAPYVEDVGELVRLGLFLLIGVQISFLNNALLKSKLRIESVARSLQHSEERYRELIGGVKDYAIVRLDPHGYVTTWNEGAQRIKGYAAQEIIGEHFSCFYPQEAIQGNELELKLQQATAAGHIEDEGWRVRKDGSRFWANVVITALYDENKRLKGFSKITRDVTHRKRMEDQLCQSIKDLSDIKFALDEAAILAITAANGIITYVNDKFCEISQYTREELVGQDHRIVNSGYHPKAFFRQLWATIAGGQVWHGEIKNRAKDGSYYWVDTTIVPFLDEQNRPLQYLVVRFDITDRKEAEEKLQQFNACLEQQVQQRTAQLQQAFEFEALLKRVTDKIRDSLDEHQILQAVVRELAVALKVVCCNTALYDLDHRISSIRYEYVLAAQHLVTQERVVLMTNFPQGYYQLLQGQEFQFCPMLTDDDENRQAILCCPIIDDQGVLGDLWLFNRPDSAFNDLEVRLVQQVATQCAIAIRQARLYQESQAQVKALEQLNWLKDDFLSTVSHELRTPVSNMKMAIRMLEIAMGREDLCNGNRHKAVQYLNILGDECQRETDLINDLLDLQRLEAGTRAIASDVIDLATWLPRMVQPFQERTVTRNQTLKVELPAAPIPPVSSDLASLERIAAELLNNACKYTPPGETIIASIQVQANWIQLQIKNSGVEIPAHELPHIFDKFYRVPSTDPWKQGGTGLGLALVKRLAEHMGGQIAVESSMNQTVFTVEIPNQSI